MMNHVVGPTRPAPTRLATGVRVRVASGVFGRTGHVRSISAGHILVHYDCGGREFIDPTRRPMWVIG
jgi:hypothetical protein